MGQEMLEFIKSQEKVKKNWVNINMKPSFQIMTVVAQSFSRWQEMQEN